LQRHADDGGQPALIGPHHPLINPLVSMDDPRNLGIKVRVKWKKARKMQKEVR
jgi:hypothetical protein